MNTPELIARLKRDQADAQAEYDEHMARAKPLLEKIGRYDAALAILPEYLDDASASGGVSLRAATLRALKELGGKGTAPRLAEIILGDPNFQYDNDKTTLKRSLRGILSRGNRDGTIVRIEHGVYALADRVENGKALDQIEGQGLFTSSGD